MKSIQVKMFVSFFSIFTIASLLISILSISLSSSALRVSTIDGITNTATQMSLLVDSRLAEQTVFMRANAKRRIVFDQTPWAEKVSQLGDAAKLSDYAYLGFVDPTGKGTLFDTAKTPVDISKEAFFATALAGTPTFSPITKDPVTGEDCIFVAAPALDKGTIVGVLFGKKSVAMLESIIKDFAFGKTGYAYLMDTTGTVVAHPDTQLVTNKFNLLDYANEHADTLTDFRDTLQNQVLKGQSGNTQYTYNDHALLSAYTPITGSDWILMVAIDQSEISAPVNNLILSLIILVLFITAIVLTATLLLGRSISSPIRYLTQIVERFGNYNFSPLSAEEAAKLQKLTTRKDEVGRVATSLVHLHANLGALITHAKDISSQLAASSQELSAISEQSALTSDSIAQNIQNISTLTNTQSKLAAEGTEQTQHIGTLIEDNSSHFQKIRASLVQVEDQKNLGATSLADLLTKTQSRDASDTEVAELVTRTVNNTTKIAKASHMLESIAAQTNLLAINSAIEAAHAGDSGKGFAVVASEIRKLAEESSGFTEEINAVISALREESTTALGKLGSSKQIAALQNTSVTTTKSQFDQIADAIRLADEAIRRGHDAVEAMNHYKNQVVSTITNLSQMSLQNADHTQEIAAAAQEQSASIQEISTASQALASLAEQLDQVVSKFKL